MPAGPVRLPILVTTAVADLDMTTKGSLAWAIKRANEQVGEDKIIIQIPGGTGTIERTAELPAITGPVTIDATGGSYTLNGSSCAANANGLKVLSDGSGSKILGLTITLFKTGAGILLEGASNCVIGGNRVGEGNTLTLNLHGIHITKSQATGNRVLGNFIGTNSTSAENLGNDKNGVYVSDGASSNFIGMLGARRNIISGNKVNGVEIFHAPSNKVAGNYVGLDVAGVEPFDTQVQKVGVYVHGDSSETLIGGLVPLKGNVHRFAANVIAGNVRQVHIEGIGAHSSKVQGNYIGTNYSGADFIVGGAGGAGGVNDYGILIEGGDRILIGGNDQLNPGDPVLATPRNIISGFYSAGVRVESSSTDTTVSNNYIGTDKTGKVRLVEIGTKKAIEIVASTRTTVGKDMPVAVAFPLKPANVIISGTADGTGIEVDSSTDTKIWGNFIGANVEGKSINAPGSSYALSNGIVIKSNGVEIGGNTKGKGNIIAGAEFNGVFVESGVTNLPILNNRIGLGAGKVNIANGKHGVEFDPGATKNRIENNDFGDNKQGHVKDPSGKNKVQKIAAKKAGIAPIDIGAPGVTLTGMPVLTSAQALGTTIGTLHSTPLHTFEIEFYGTHTAAAAGFGQLEQYLGSVFVTTDEEGHADIDWYPTPTYWRYITATATDLDPEGGTSEVSATVPVDDFEAHAPEVMFLYDPQEGSAAGGYTGYLAGAHFTAATQVLFGDVPVSDFSASDYAIAFVVPPHAPGTVNVTVTTPFGTSAASELDEFTYVADPETASVSGLAWADADGDGWRGWSEVGMAGVAVTLVALDGTQRQTTTDSNGAYSFTALPPGEYHVCFTAPSGHDFTAPGQDSDADFGGETFAFTLAVGGSVAGMDVGLVPTPAPVTTAGIRGRAWADANGDGIQQATEVGVAGLFVDLIDEATQQVVATVETDAEGWYEFAGLAPGSYSLVFRAAGSPTFTLKDEGDDDYDSDANANGSTDILTLVAGDIEDFFDAGLIL